MDSNEIEEFNSISQLVVNKFSREYRNLNGQFFSSATQVNLCLETISKYISLTDLNILEPSCGTGQFFDGIFEFCSNSVIHGYEKDTKIYNLIRKVYRNRFIGSNQIELSIHQGDFLKNNNDVKYDLIIGNPPYNEIKDKIYKSNLITGRYNIYALFLEKSINMLAEKGIVCFILPQTMMTAPSFRKLRKFIIERCNILEIINMNNFSSEVAQDINIYIFQLSSEDSIKTRDFIFGDNLFSFSRINEDFNKLECIKDISKVMTGTIVWNQYKDDLNDKKIGYRLIYSDDVGCIKDDIPKLKRNKEKLPYINTKKDPIILPAIFVARTKILRFELVLSSKVDLIAENHINVITGDTESLSRIYESLKTKKCEEYFKNISTTLNVSKTQLENIPLFE